MLIPREKYSLPEKFSPEEDRTHDAASSRTASPTHYQRAIPALLTWPLKQGWIDYGLPSAWRLTRLAVLQVLTLAMWKLLYRKSVCQSPNHLAPIVFSVVTASSELLCPSAMLARHGDRLDDRCVAVRLGGAVMYRTLPLMAMMAVGGGERAALCAVRSHHQPQPQPRRHKHHRHSVKQLRLRRVVLGAVPVRAGSNRSSGGGHVLWEAGDESVEDEDDGLLVDDLHVRREAVVQRVPHSQQEGLLQQLSGSTGSGQVRGHVRQDRTTRYDDGQFLQYQLSTVVLQSDARQVNY